MSGATPYTREELKAVKNGDAEYSDEQCSECGQDCDRWLATVAERDARIAELESAMRDWVVCVHCQMRFRSDSDEVERHGRTCPKHPQREVERALAAAQARVKELEIGIARVLGEGA